jgi:hypothetical protein
MKHLSEEELIELYYGEAQRAASAHLESCRECAAQYTELTLTLDGICRAEDRELPAGYGERVWLTLRPRLIPHGKTTRGWREWTQWRAVTLAASGAMLLALAFLGGRYWERHAAQRGSVAVIVSPKAAQRTVLVVLTDHLDRTERLLVALEHADLSGQAENAQLRSEARELLASNRLYRTTASEAGDPMLASALDRLNGVLAEMANDEDLTAQDLQWLRQAMNTQGILFEIRVLIARRPDQGNLQNHARGRTI